MRSLFQRDGTAFVLRIVTTVSLGPLIAAGCVGRESPRASADQSSPVVRQAPAGVNSPPPALLDVGETAEELFDAARVSNWKDAAIALRTMNESADELPVTFSKAGLTAQLQSRLEELSDTVSQQQRLRTMDFANQITQLVADLSGKYQTQVPYALVMLGFYGRELELGIAAGDQARLKQAAADLRQTWNRFEGRVLQRGAVDEARRFTDIVVQLEGAQTTADFVEPTREELDAARSDARFAGIRTFTMLGGMGGLCGWLWTTGATTPAAILLAGAMALIALAYRAASRLEVEGTTEVAALVVVAGWALVFAAWMLARNAPIWSPVSLPIFSRRLVVPS